MSQFHYPCHAARATQGPACIRYISHQCSNGMISGGPREVQWPELRPVAEVAAILNPSPRRAALVGILHPLPGRDAQVELAPDAGMMCLVPCDPRMPRCSVAHCDIPKEILAQVQVLSYAEPYVLMCPQRNAKFLWARLRGGPVVC